MIYHPIFELVDAMEEEVLPLLVSAFVEMIHISIPLVAVVRGCPGWFIPSSKYLPIPHQCTEPHFTNYSWYILGLFWSVLWISSQFTGSNVSGSIIFFGLVGFLSPGLSYKVS